MQSKINRYSGIYKFSINQMMSLQFKPLSKAETEKQLKSVNLDISILNKLAQPSAVSKDLDLKPKPSKMSLNDLSSILINKNKKFRTQKQDIKQTIEWLQQKGLNWKKMNFQIKQNALLSQQQAPSLKPKPLEFQKLEPLMAFRGLTTLQPQGQVKFTKDMQQEFIQKQKQTALCQVIMNSMRSTKQKSNTRSALINKIRGQQGSKNSSFHLDKQLLTADLGSPQFKVKSEDIIKNEYFDFVRNLAVHGFDSSIQQLKKIKPFWKIVLEHIKTVQHYAAEFHKLSLHERRYHQGNEHELSPQESQHPTQTQLKINTYVMIKSLKTIERQFEKSLPDTQYSFEKLDEVVRDMERRSHKLKIWRNYNGQATWAMTFLLLRAGRINQIKRVLQSVDRQVLSEIIAHHQSIHSQYPKHPERSERRHDIHKYNDTFYCQIIKILEGKPKFDPLILNNSTQLTKIWLVLMTLGIYRYNGQINEQFNFLNEQLINKECESNEGLTESKIEQLIYLGNYKNLIYFMEVMLERRMAERDSGYFTHDDYFHLLAVLNYYPELWGNSTQTQIAGLEGKFANALSQYMRKIKLEGFNIQVPSYLLLSPLDKIQQVACSFIRTAQQYKQFDWKSFRDLLIERDPDNGNKLYFTLSKQVLDSLQLSKFYDFLFAADTYRINFSQTKDSLYLQQKNYLKALLGHLYFVQKKKLLIRTNKPSKDFDAELFDFFGMSQHQQSQNAITLREKQINNNLRQCEKKLDYEIVRDSVDEQYVKNVILPYGFYKKFNQISRMMQNPANVIPQLDKFDPQWTKILSQNQLNCIISSPQAILLRFLGFEFDKANYSGLYIYYLHKLIERKKFLCSINCDYSGVISEFRFILRQLQALQTHYRNKQQEMRKRQGRVFGEEKRILFEESTNPLNECPQYLVLKETIREYIGESIERSSTRDNFGSSYQKSFNTQERRRSMQSW